MELRCIPGDSPSPFPRGFGQFLFPVFAGKMLKFPGEFRGILGKFRNFFVQKVDKYPGIINYNFFDFPRGFPGENVAVPRTPRFPGEITPYLKLICFGQNQFTSQNNGTMLLKYINQIITVLFNVYLNLVCILKCA